MKIILNRSWGSNRRGKVYDYPEKTARYLVERVKVADYFEEKETEEKPVEKTYETKVLKAEDALVEEAVAKKRGRPKKAEYETKVLKADVDEE